MGFKLEDGDVSGYSNSNLLKKTNTALHQTISSLFCKNGSFKPKGDLTLQINMTKTHACVHQVFQAYFRLLFLYTPSLQLHNSH